MPGPDHLPQRVLVGGDPGPALDTFVRRAAEVLDLPLVRLAELTGPDDLARLAAFDGWLTPLGYDAAPAPLLERAEAAVHLDVPLPGLGTRVRRTLRRLRADGPPPAEVWLHGLRMGRPDLPVVSLTTADDVEEWLRRLSR